MRLLRAVATGLLGLSILHAGDSSIDVRQLVEAFTSLRGLSQVRCSYLVQSLPEDEPAGILTVKADVLVRDVGAHRVTWSEWPASTPLPAGAVPDVAKNCKDLRSTGLSVATIRNQHQILADRNGKMSIWTFKPLEANKGLEYDDDRLRGSLVISADAAYEVPVLKPIQALLQGLRDLSQKSADTNAIPGLAFLAIAPDSFGKGLSKVVDKRQQLADGATAYRVRLLGSDRSDAGLWIVACADPAAGGAMVIREISTGPKDQYKPGFLGTTITYTTVACGDKQVPIVKQWAYDADRGTPFWELGILISATADPKLRDTDVAIDASSAKVVFDVATGMERER